MTATYAILTRKDSLKELEIKQDPILGLEAIEAETKGVNRLITTMYVTSYMVTRKLLKTNSGNFKELGRGAATFGNQCKRKSCNRGFLK